MPTADSGPTSIVAGPDSNLYFGESNAFKLGRITPAGRIAQFPVPAKASDTGDGDDGPTRLVASGGGIWFISDDFTSLYRMDLSGSLSPDLGWDGTDAIGLGAADTGGVWLFDGTADGGAGPQALQRVDPAPGYGVTAYRTDYVNQVFAPLALAPDGHTAWYAEDSPGGDYLAHIDDAGAQSKLPIPTADATYDVTSMGFASNGTLWFTEHAPYDYSFPVGGAIGELTRGSSVPKIVWAVADNVNVAPESLVAGSGGTMYFTYADGIGEITAAGRVTMTSLAPYHPGSLAYGSGGDLWFTDTTANTIGRVSPAALFGTTAGGTHPPATGKNKRPPASRPIVTVPKQKLAAVARRRRLTVRCALAGAGTCQVTATVGAGAGGALGLKPKRKAKTVALAHASRRLPKRGRATLALRIGRTVAKRLRRDKRLALQLTATSTSPRHRARTVRRKLTLHR